MRLSEILKENKELKSTSSHMERTVDELAEEKGALSSQVIMSSYASYSLRLFIFIF